MTAIARIGMLSWIAAGIMGYPNGRIAASPPRLAAFRVAVHQAGPGAAAFAQAVRAAGFQATLLSDSQMADGSLDRTRFNAILLPDASRCPILAKSSLLRFLGAGGDMVVVGGALFERSVRTEQQSWLARLRQVNPDHPIIDFASEDTRAWQHGSSNNASRTVWTVERTGPPEAPADLRMEVGDLTGWDTLARPTQDAFPDADSLTVFWAKGDSRTRHLAFEWGERDGSRWIADVPLTTNWRKIVLAPEDFGYWPDNPSKGRGGSGDHFRPQNAARLSIGLAIGNTTITPGHHVFWMAGIGAGKLPAGAQKPDLSLPSLELFSPWYKYYHLPSLHPTAAQLARESATGDQRGAVVTPIPRPRGLAFAGDRHARWIPLSWIRDTSGRVCGTRESLYLNLTGSYKGSIWGQLAGANSPAQLHNDAIGLLRRMSDGLFLTKAGAEQFSYFAGESVPIGFDVANLSRQQRKAEVVLSLGAPGSKRSASVLRVSVRRDPGATGLPFSAPPALRWRPPKNAVGVYRAVSELRVDGRTVDRIEQEFSILPNPRPSRSAFVTVQNGVFLAPALQYRKSKNGNRKSPWSPYGLNYWQSNVAGLAPEEYFGLHWLSPGYYDPEVVERDLATLQSLGFTAVSIQVTQPDHLRQANDFTARAARHGIRTNVFVGGAHPFYTDEKLFTQLITQGRFANNPNIWAYDIAWEHHLGNHEERTRWDPDWEHWVIERYGSIAHAEKDWGVAIPRDVKGKVTNPSDQQLRADGPWTKMAVAYERCADDVVSRRYARVIAKIRRLDPNHLISARSASQPSWTGWFAYDLVSTGKHFDFSSPEGYGLKPQEAGFTVAYARWAGNGKPVFWAEFGSSIYPYDTTGESEARQAALHRGFAQMLLDSGANGLCSWWNVGGYRVDERSDFGIVAPDGTPRISALQLQRYASRVTAPRMPKKPTTWVTIDRDLHAAAYQAVYENHKQSYVDAVKRGGMVGVRTAGTGTTSLNCPLVAVGEDMPYDGFEPLKYLNAEFNRIEILGVNGRWQDLTDGGTVQVAAGRPVMARVSVGNTGEATWQARAVKAPVRLIGDDRPDSLDSGRPKLTFVAPLPRDTARYQDVALGPVMVAKRIQQPSEVVFTMEAERRARFGPRVHVLLNSVPR